MRLTIDKVIHHHDVVLVIIVRPWSDITRSDSHTGDTRVVKLDGEERQPAVSG
jgi:hypothetical protein